MIAEALPNSLDFLLFLLGYIHVNISLFLVSDLKGLHAAVKNDILVEQVALFPFG